MTERSGRLLKERSAGGVWYQSKWTWLTAVLCGVSILGVIVVCQRFLGVEADSISTIEVALSNGVRKIVVEEFHPMSDRSERLPAVLYLHGVEGASRYRFVHSRSCRSLADQGYRVFYVHYFGAVDYPDLWHLCDDGSLNRTVIDARCRADAALWCDAVLQVVRSISQRSDVDCERIAIDGISLGGYIGLEVAEETVRRSDLPNIQAVVANWAAQFDITECEHGFPPTLHVHGELDDVVPLRDAEQSVAEIRSAGSAAELLVVPGSGHAARSRLSDERTRDFLLKHLKSGDCEPSTVSSFDERGAL